MRNFLNLTYIDLANIIKASNEAGRKGEYVTELFIIKPDVATKGINSSIIIHSSALESATESEPNPYISIGI